MEVVKARRRTIVISDSDDSDPEETPDAGIRRQPRERKPTAKAAVAAALKVIEAKKVKRT